MANPPGPQARGSPAGSGARYLSLISQPGTVTRVIIAAAQATG